MVKFLSFSAFYNFFLLFGLQKVAALLKTQDTQTQDTQTQNWLKTQDTQTQNWPKTQKFWVRFGIGTCLIIYEKLFKNYPPTFCFEWALVILESM